MARAANAEALWGITVQVQRDSVFVQGTLYDAAAARLVGGPILAQGRREDLEDLVSPMAFTLLGIDEEASSQRGHGTKNLPAFEHFLKGRDSFFQADLSVAQDRFREAVQADSAFATGLSWLSLSLYWNAVEGSGRLSSLRPEIARFSTLAQDHLSTVTGADSLHVAAFFAFQRGEYEEGRRLYQLLIHSNPRDIVAWLMIGELELNDLWLIPDDFGIMKPRANLNSSLASFQRTTVIRPSFELGYAKSFRVAEVLESTHRLRACSLFAPLRPDPVPPGSGPGVQNATAFCPVFRDSVEWVPKAEFDVMDPGEVSTGADRIFNRAVRMLEVWENFAPSAPRPKEFISEVLIARRHGLPDQPAR